MTQSLQVPIPEGALFTVTTGSYSDYMIVGVFRAVVTLDVDALITEYCTEKDKIHPNTPPRPFSLAWKHRFEGEEFLVWLGPKIDPVECFEMHIDNDSYYISEVTDQ